MSATSIIPVVQSNDFASELSTISIFRDLPVTVMNVLSENGDFRQYGAGDTIFSAGNFDASEFFVVMSGCARVSRIAPKTGAIMIEDLGAGSVFGLELAMLEFAGEAVRSVSVTAEKSLKLLVFDGSEFRALASQRPSLMRNVAMFCAEELSEIRLRVRLSEPAPHQRVYTALLNFVQRDTVTGEWRIHQMPKHRHLAEQAGVEETVTADAVATLIQDGVAQRDYPGMLINDISKLNKLAG